MSSRGNLLSVVAVVGVLWLGAVPVLAQEDAGGEGNVAAAGVDHQRHGQHACPAAEAGLGHAEEHRRKRTQGQEEGDVLDLRRYGRPGRHDGVRPPLG